MKKNTDKLNLDLCIRFFEDLVDMLKELKDLRLIHGVENSANFTSKNNLQPLDLLSVWPNALPSALICDQNSEEEKLNRANGLIQEFFLHSYNSVLDYGCGEGHLAHVLSKHHNKVLGFDIASCDNLFWQNSNLLTKDFNLIIQNAPYKLIIMYDLLDHVVDESPVEVLTKARSLLDHDGEIFIRFHPWCSRHGGHTCHQMNKAFLHFILTSEELSELGISVPANLKIIHPLKTYKNWITRAGLNIKNEQTQRQPVESFFIENPAVKSRICRLFQLPLSDFPYFQMEQVFIDVVCER
jgi:2-polyprenyl-3-methyl-5-hydroxy-6-metoxy-1,4-benzoquinol methylase